MGGAEPTANFCTSCGQAIHGAKFCPNCGAATGVEEAVEQPVVVAAASVDEDEITPPLTNGHSEPALADTADLEYRPTARRFEPSLEAPAPPRAPTPPRPPAPPRVPAAEPAPRRRTGFIVAAVALVVLLAGGVAAFVLMSGSSSTSDANATYRQNVAKAFGPVLGANRQVSNTLAALHGTDRANARLAVRRARQATTAATGALTALTPPAGSERLGADARQVLDREAAYLASVATVLDQPSVGTASQIQTLASNLTSALHAAGPTVAGTSETVSGADRLVTWARQTQATLKHRAKAKAKARAERRARTTGGSGGTATAPAANPYANGRSCGDGVYAGPNTSCEFAQNVRRAYDEAPGATASIRAYSPATGQTYTMYCAPSGSGVTCSGANNASVTF
jgi:hypothetical protein